MDFEEDRGQSTPIRPPEGAKRGVTQPQSVAVTPEVIRSQPTPGTSRGGITTPTVLLLPPEHFSLEGAVEEAQPGASKSVDQVTPE